MGIVLNSESVNSPLSTSGPPGVRPATVSVPTLKLAARSGKKKAEKLAWY